MINNVFQNTVNLHIGCTCSNYTGGTANATTGIKPFGRCKNKYKDWFGGKVFCYVNLPTSCTDVREGKKGKKSSALACDDCSVPANNVKCNNGYNTNKNLVLL